MSTSIYAFNIRVSNLQVRNVQTQIGAQVRIDLALPSSKQTTDDRTAFDPSWSDVYRLHETVNIQLPNSSSGANRKIMDSLEKIQLNVGLKTFRSKCCGGAFETVGTTHVDLYTLATGPKTYKDISLRSESGQHAADISFTCEAFQITRPLLRVIDVDISALEPYMDCGARNLGLIAKYIAKTGTTRAETKPAWGGTKSRRFEQMEFKADFEELQDGKLSFDVCFDDSQHWSTNGIVARASVPSREFILPWQKAVPFTCDLVSPVTGGVFGPLHGRVHCENGPDFVQMKTGQYIGGVGIKYGEYMNDEVTFKPTCSVQLKKRVSKAPMFNFAGVGRGSMDVPQTVNEDSAYTNANTNGAGPGPAPPPADKNQGSQGDHPVVQLPYFWERIMNDKNEASFYNKITKKTVSELPYCQEVTYRFERSGYLGISLDWNYSGRSELGYSSGRRLSGTDVTAIIKNVMPGLQAYEKKEPPIEPGFQIIEINGTSTLDRDHKDTDKLLASAGRPLEVKMFNPYAVSKKVARYSKRREAEILYGDKADIIRKGKRSKGESDGSSSAYDTEEDPEVRQV